MFIFTTEIKTTIMKTIQLTKELDEKITHWNIRADVIGVTKISDSSFNRKDCKKPETAIKRFKKKWGSHNVKNIVLTGLLTHAETKPIIVDKN